MTAPMRAAAATILNSSHAVEMSIHIVRAFVQPRGLFAGPRVQYGFCTQFQ